MSPPLVSIVIPTKDRPALLRAALESLALQSRRDFEAVVVNDGGSSVEDVVADFRQAFSLDLVELPTNRGLAAARNVALARVTGAATAFLDDDDLLLPDAVETIALHEPSTDSVIYFDCEVHDNRVEPRRTELRRTPMALFNFPFSKERLLACNYIPIISAVCWGGAGNGHRFDENLVALEDWDFLLGALKQTTNNFRHVSHRTSIYHRLVGASSMTNDALADIGRRRGFSESYESVCRRHASRSSVVNCGREAYRSYERVIERMLIAGRCPRPDAYERLLTRIDDVMASAPDEAELSSILKIIVE